MDNPFMHGLDREFWLLILATWTMDEIITLQDYADSVERNTKWSNRHAD